MAAIAMHLYETTDALLTVREWVEEHEEELLASGGDLDALPELKELIDKAEGDFNAKVERVAIFARELLASAEAQKATAKAIRAVATEHDRKATALENTAEGLKVYMLHNLERANLARVEGKLRTVRRQLSGASVRHELDAVKLAELHKQGCPFTVEHVSHELPADGLREAYKAAVARVAETFGARPKPGEENYEERLIVWKADVRRELEKEGVPAGVTVEQREHIRIV